MDELEREDFRKPKARKELKVGMAVALGAPVATATLSRVPDDPLRPSPFTSRNPWRLRHSLVL